MYSESTYVLTEYICTKSHSLRQLMTGLQKDLC